MYKLFVLFLLSSVFSVTLVSANNSKCGKGQYFTGKKYSGNKYQCKPCPNGYYQSNGSHLEKKCKAVSPGYKANKSSGATMQNECPAGKFSRGKTSTCSTCPAGAYCPNKKMAAPKKCAPGSYMPNSGSKYKCYSCPAGKFSSAWGSASCCDCCRGFYQDKKGATKCKYCPVGKRAGGKAADSIGDCTPGNPLKAAKKCQMSGNKCPKTEGDGLPVSQAPYQAKRDNVRCGKGYKRCGLLHGRGGFDCVDIANDVESCGGCIDFSNKPDSGKDCTAIEGAGNVQCVRGKCVVHSCKPGFAMNADGVCEPALTV